MRGIGLVLIIAFVSLWLQVDALIGSAGILPAAELLSHLQSQGVTRLWMIPSVFWLSSSDFAIHLVLALGTIAGISITLGYRARIALVIAWISWLSLLAVGQIFLSYQWDVLLLETCFLAILGFPNKKHLPFRHTPALDFFCLTLFRLLLFRLMFSSGFVKLASGDPHWNSLEALRYHFLSQPLPTPLAAFVHQLPDVLLDTGCFLVFVIELLLPFFIFGPRLLQLVSGASFLIFQILIALTGNYTFFNLLSILLVLPLFDDAFFSRVFRLSSSAQEIASPLNFKNILRQPLTLFVACLALLQLWVLLLGYTNTPRPFQELLRSVRPFRTVNSYGLFAIMTTKRFELQIEGSRDGQNWQEYQFRWKPGDVNAAPRFLAPHQARVDWQLWFASLGSLQQNPWVLRLAEQVLRGNPAVLDLFAEVPFPQEPPKYVRILHYEYDFSSSFVRESEGRWWHRRLLGIYLPAISLEDE